MSYVCVHCGEAVEDEPVLTVIGPTTRGEVRAWHGSRDECMRAHWSWSAMRELIIGDDWR